MGAKDGSAPDTPLNWVLPDLPWKEDVVGPSVHFTVKVSLDKPMDDPLVPHEVASIVKEVSAAIDAASAAMRTSIPMEFGAITVQLESCPAELTDQGCTRPAGSAARYF